ncbi:hypothetical protein OBBRIDRAFT_815103 [Obba rivulosa]|uniref:Uncharacterized protein n=1 Tax=Obba rivulosa TaxID=1052685 RepID=A0A8E2ANR6_9APHY|nr:hypothetical protein OBBRIDRAFT_815103 [Obba rivulosa]
MTPVPHSPHSPSLALPGLDEDDDMLGEPVVHSPLDRASTHGATSAGTLAPSLLAPAPREHEGLGLLLDPISIDPPLARSPSPDDDDLDFLDVQLDPSTTHLAIDEFLHLRAVRKRALAAERAARAAEAELGERVAGAANALLPPLPALGMGVPEIDAGERRVRKRELHAAMDARAEARRQRKREKQRSKEVGALLDLKMSRADTGGVRTIAQLVANMVLRRRDTVRPLASRRVAAVPHEHVRSALFRSVSAEDLAGKAGGHGG